MNRRFPRPDISRRSQQQFTPAQPQLQNLVGVVKIFFPCRYYNVRVRPKLQKQHRSLFYYEVVLLYTGTLLRKYDDEVHCTAPWGDVFRVNSYTSPHGFIFSLRIELAVARTLALRLVPRFLLIFCVEDAQRYAFPAGTWSGAAVSKTRFLTTQERNCHFGDVFSFKLHFLENLHQVGDEN